MNYDIYVIENILNGKTYVGRTKYPMLMRWKAHMNAPTVKTALGRDVIEFGKASFTLRLLDTARNNIEAGLKERLYTHLLESNIPEFGYNNPQIYKWPIG